MYLEQKIFFITQINVARDTGLPLIIHSRDADEDMINILTSEFKNGPFKAILHCFSSGKKLALCGLDLGFYITLYGDHISLFPILASIAIFFYTKMTTGQQMMPASQTGGVNMKVIMYMMPLMMLFFQPQGSRRVGVE